MAQRLAEDLRRFEAVPAISSGVADALGLERAAEIATNANSLLGYLLIPGDVVFEAYLCCTRSVRIFQLTGEGHSLSLLFPVARITRVAEERPPGGSPTLTIEVDADAHAYNGDMLIGPALDEAGELIENHLAARTSSLFLPVTYRLVQDTRLIGDFAAFARALRRMLGG